MNSIWPSWGKKGINYLNQSCSPSEIKLFMNWSCPSLLTSRHVSFWDSREAGPVYNLQVWVQLTEQLMRLGQWSPDPLLTIRSDPSFETYRYVSHEYIRHTPISEFVITLCVQRALTGLEILSLIDYIVRWPHPGGLSEEFIQTLKGKQTGLQPCTVMDPWENSGFQGWLGHSN